MEIFTSFGSSLHVQGKLCLCDCGGVSKGFIPARAGRIIVHKPMIQNESFRILVVLIHRFKQPERAIAC
jgi:hypothetical protein